MEQIETFISFLALYLSFAFTLCKTNFINILRFKLTMKVFVRIWKKKRKKNDINDILCIHPYNLIKFNVYVYEHKCERNKNEQKWKKILK